MCNVRAGIMLRSAGRPTIVQQALSPGRTAASVAGRDGLGLHQQPGGLL